MFRTIIISILFFLFAFAAAQDAEQDFIKAADEAYAQNDIDTALDLYKKAMAKDSSYESLWKYARTLIDKGNLTEDEDKKENIYRSSVAYADKAIKKNPGDAEGYFVKAMCVGKVALVAGGKEKVELSRSVKENAMKAIELNPKHDGALHVLARWHREVANLSWVLKSVAKIIYGGLPDASNEEAVKYFKRAIEIKPNHIKHHFELAKTYMEMDKDQEAIKELRIVLELKPIQADDPKLQKEAKEMLDDLL
jgi:tetratricopeptide (TPR) repeat protein